ncbi:hypothetical protein AB4144_14035 [Rhizobiaceae sp. 2RAB30]
MKIFSILTKPLAQVKFFSEDERAAWARDPLSHPELEQMSVRELADLPFNRGYRQPASARACCG